MNIFKKKTEKKDKEWRDISLDEFMLIDEISNDKKPAKALRVTHLLYGDEGGSIEFLNTPPAIEKWKKEYWINGHRYRLQADMTKFTISQMIDYQSGINIRDWLSVVLVPYKSKTYNDGSYDLNSVKEDIQRMSIVDALAVANFLKGQCMELSLILTDFLSQKKTEIERMNTLSQEEKTAILSQITGFLSFVRQSVATTA